MKEPGMNDFFNVDFLGTRDNAPNTFDIPGGQQNASFIRPEMTVQNMSLNPDAARRLSNTTKTLPMMECVTPRFLLRLLPWVALQAGVYRVNRLRRLSGGAEIPVTTDYMHMGESTISGTYPDYEDAPREYILSVIQTILRLNTNISDIFNDPYNQKDEQMRLTIEAMKEMEEWEIINDREFGLVSSVAPGMRVRSRSGFPSPDDMDELSARVWKKPAFFLAHPRAIAAICRECTRRGVPPTTVNIFGSPFLTWRGVPIIPCDKLTIRSRGQNGGGKTDILLMRVGEKEQGVVGLHQPGLPDERDVPSLSVKLAGIDERGIASYILSLYFSVAVLAQDALGMLEDVEVGNYYDYK